MQQPDTTVSVCVRLYELLSQTSNNTPRLTDLSTYRILPNFLFGINSGTEPNFSVNNEHWFASIWISYSCQVSVIWWWCLFMSSLQCKCEILSSSNTTNNRQNWTQRNDWQQFTKIVDESFIRIVKYNYLRTRWFINMNYFLFLTWHTRSLTSLTLNSLLTQTLLITLLCSLK